MTFVRVCNVSEISSQKPKLYIINGVKILVVKDAASKVWAFDSTCTHADKSLENAKWDSQNAMLTCPFHCAVFSISQGGLAVSPPAVLPLKIYPAKIENINSDTILFIDLDG